MGSGEGCQHALFCSMRSAGHSGGVGTFLEDGQTSVSAIGAGLESSYIGAAQNLQIRHFTCVELQDMDKITRTALHNMCIDRTCRLD